MKKGNIIAIIILIFLCISCTVKVIEHNDTFYLIKLGEYISKNGIDFLDHFSWIPNLVYTYPHWLYTIFIYFIYNNFGFTGIYIGNMITYITLILSIYYITLKYNKDNFLAFFISFISILVLKSFIVPRSQSISILLFLWEVYFIRKLIDTGNKKYIIYLAIDSLLIANIHGTAWTMMFVLYLPFIVSHLIYLFIDKKKINFKLKYRISVERTKNFKLVLLSLVICFLMGLLTPSKICYTYIFKTMLGISQNYIDEHAPLIIIRAPIIIIIIFLLYFSKEKVKLSEFFMISGLLIMSFISSRHQIFMYTIGFIYLSIILKRELNIRNDKTFDILDKKLFKNNFIATIIILISFIICTTSIVINKNKKYIDESYYPVDATTFIKENLNYKNIKLFNHYDIGSYLLFNDIKVFIDSRCDLYFKEFGNTDIFEDYINILEKYNYEEIFEKYNTEYVLINNSEALNHIIKKDIKYKNIYQDEYFVIYERKENI